MFLSFDGIDGAGKSTQIKLLEQYLLEQGNRVVCFRDPGSTPLGEAVREILLHREEIPLASTAEMLLYMAARAQLVEEQIRPALDSQTIVLCDRYLLANVVYQGVASGLDVETLWQVGRCATGGLNPDATLILDLDPEIAVKRIERGHDRLEKRGIEYFRKVRAGFLEQRHHCGGPSIVLSAEQSPEVVALQVRQFLSTIGMATHSG